VKIKWITPSTEHLINNGEVLLTVIELQTFFIILHTPASDTVAVRSELMNMHRLKDKLKPFPRQEHKPNQDLIRNWIISNSLGRYRSNNSMTSSAIGTAWIWEMQPWGQKTIGMWTTVFRNKEGMKVTRGSQILTHAFINITNHTLAQSKQI